MMNHRSFSLAYKIKVSGILFSFALDSQLGHRVRFGEYFTNLLSHRRQHAVRTDCMRARYGMGLFMRLDHLVI